MGCTEPYRAFKPGNIFSVAASCKIQGIYMREEGRVNLECPFKNGDKRQLSKVENRGNAAQESPESIGSGTARESAARAVRKSNK